MPDKHNHYGAIMPHDHNKSRHSSKNSENFINAMSEALAALEQEWLIKVELCKGQLTSPENIYLYQVYQAAAGIKTVISLHNDLQGE